MYITKLLDLSKLTYKQICHIQDISTIKQLKELAASDGFELPDEIMAMDDNQYLYTECPDCGSSDLDSGPDKTLYCNHCHSYFYPGKPGGFRAGPMGWR